MKRFPAEWESQSHVLLTWPHENSDWAPILPAVTELYTALATRLADYVEVVIACDPCVFHSVTHLFSSLSDRIQVFKIETDDTWARDHGPISVEENGSPKLLNFTFNAWGNKFSHNKDNAINKALDKSNAFGERLMIDIDFVLEGGAIESDGNGTLMTTEECLLNENRNGRINKHDVELQLKEHFAVEHIVWVTNGYLAGDDTDSHIDTLARFAPNNTIVYVKCEDESDEHFEALNKMEQCLNQQVNAQGESFTLIPLPFPDAIFDEDGERLPATYANFLITNSCVFVPIYSVQQDQQALDQISLAFPEHKIISLDCRPLIEQHGSLHCITMQVKGTPPHRVGVA